MTSFNETQIELARKRAKRRRRESNFAIALGVTYLLLAIFWTGLLFTGLFFGVKWLIENT